MQAQVTTALVFLVVAKKLLATKEVFLVEEEAGCSEAQVPQSELQQSFGAGRAGLAGDAGVGEGEGEEQSRSSQSRLASGHVGESR
jgi:hypothetical protein